MTANSLACRACHLCLVLNGAGLAGENHDLEESEALLHWDERPEGPDYGAMFDRCRRIEPTLSSEASGLLQRFFYSCRRMNQYPT